MSPIISGGGSSGGTSLTTVDAHLTADVPLTSGAYVDGTSASFAAGTWLIVYKCVCALSGAQEEEYTARLWDGTTIYDESQNDVQTTAPSAGDVCEVTGLAVVVLAATTTLKVSVRADHASQVLKQDVTAGSGSSHTATRLSGVKVA